jgi:hypothetical protein
MMGFGGGLIGAAIAMYVMPPRAREVEVQVPVVVEALPPAKGPSDVQMVFRAGDATYMKLADAPTLHVRMTVYDRGEVDHWETTAVGDVEAATIPKEHQHWLGQRVVVDGTCTANVTGFAVVARLKGEAGYAGEDSKWTADSIYQHGTPVLAAKLDNCAQGMFARDASLAPIVIPEIIDDAALAKRAQDKLFASAPGNDAQLEYEQHEGKGAWTKSEDTSIETLVVRDPRTRVTWVSVHASLKAECGGADINIWGLYRVDGDQLVTAQQRDLGELYKIDRLIDLEGDGELEIIGTPWWGGDHVVQRASGDEVTRLVMSFYGCPC